MFDNNFLIQDVRWTPENQATLCARIFWPMRPGKSACSVFRPLIHSSGNCVARRQKKSHPSQRSTTLISSNATLALDRVSPAPRISMSNKSRHNLKMLFSQDAPRTFMKRGKILRRSPRPVIQTLAFPGHLCQHQYRQQLQNNDSSASPQSVFLPGTGGGRLALDSVSAMGCRT